MFLNSLIVRTVEMSLKETRIVLCLTIFEFDYVHYFVIVDIHCVVLTICFEITILKLIC